MKHVLSGGACAAAVLACGIAVSAQTAPQSQPPAMPQPPTTTSAPATQDTTAGAQSITVTGCVQREADYRRANNIGKGGVVGTGVGADNEFVLVNAATGAGTAVTDTTAAPATTAAPQGTTGTTGTATATAGEAYELTGPNENQLSQYIGKRVEITGRLKKMEAGKAGIDVSGSAAGGTATAGVTARKGQVDPMNRDLKLRELEISSVREVSGSCAK